MYIHRVSSGDSIFSLCGKYKILPTKLVEDNGIQRERLAQGEELLILMPTRQGAVRGGDNLSKFALRYGIKKNSILVNNPSLMGGDYLPPGKMLTVKYSPPTLGVASGIGYLHGGCPFDKFKLAIPYLTYVVAYEYSLCAAGVLRESSLERYTAYARSKSRLTLLGIHDKTAGELLESEEKHAGLCEQLCDIAACGGYGGIYLSFIEASDMHTDKYAEFLLMLRRCLIGRDLVLFTDVSEDTPAEISDMSDASVLCDRYGYPRGYNKSSDALSKFADAAESSGAFFCIDCSGKCGKDLFDISDAKRLATRNAKEIIIDDETLLCSFGYNKFSHIGKEYVEVSFPSLEKIKREFELGAELGYMGYAFDIAHVPISYLCMFNSLFSRADYLNNVYEN